MTYAVPQNDILFATKRAAGDGAFDENGIYPDLAGGLLEATVSEAAKFAENQLYPLDREGDRVGARFENGVVATAPGWRAAYEAWIAGGWNALAAPSDYGGAGLPLLLSAACTEIWNSANMAFALCPLLGQGAIEALEAHASDALKAEYLGKIVSGEWTATMNLTEAQAGTDLALLRMRAEPAGEGAYRLFGQKIFITYGEHDLSDNIVHMVLARLPGAPQGVKGVSLFLAPKMLPDATGALTRRNDIRCAGVEHKMGVHGSPTCTMAYGDGEGALAFLVGEENAGLSAMFTMMNNARLNVGLQGVAMAERATQHALGYARQRLQGRLAGSDAAVPIIEHPDVARMLLTMSSMTAAARAICLATAASGDLARRVGDPVRAKQAKDRVALLTPLAKAFSTDLANEAASLGVQVFGGMGFIEEAGAAQLMRDARICAIYEGANGVQAIDLVTRKLRLDGGAALRREIADMRRALAQAVDMPELRRARDEAQAAIDAFEKASDYLEDALATAPNDALAGATPYLRLFGLARGAAFLIEHALVARRENADAARRAALARFFCAHLATGAPGLAQTIISGADAVIEGRAAFAS